MAFVNEYISKEDIEKYDIFGIWNKFLPEREHVKKETEKRYIPQWTIDRERFGFLMQEELLPKI